MGENGWYDHVQLVLVLAVRSAAVLTMLLGASDAEPPAHHSKHVSRYSHGSTTVVTGASSPCHVSIRSVIRALVPVVTGFLVFALVFGFFGAGFWFLVR